MGTSSSVLWVLALVYANALHSTMERRKGITSCIVTIFLWRGKEGGGKRERKKVKKEEEVKVRGSDRREGGSESERRGGKGEETTKK